MDSSVQFVGQISRFFSYAQASAGLDTLVEWLPDLDSCPDQFTTAARACSGVGSRNGRLVGAGGEGDRK